jgi:hypothetical protein
MFMKLQDVAPVSEKEWILDDGCMAVTMYGRVFLK